MDGGVGLEVMADRRKLLADLDRLESDVVIVPTPADLYEPRVLRSNADEQVVVAAVLAASGGLVGAGGLP